MGALALIVNLRDGRRGIRLSYFFTLVENGHGVGKTVGLWAWLDCLVGQD